MQQRTSSQSYLAAEWKAWTQPETRVIQKDGTSTALCDTGRHASPKQSRVLRLDCLTAGPLICLTMEDLSTSRAAPFELRSITDYCAVLFVSQQCKSKIGEHKQILIYHQQIMHISCSKPRSCIQFVFRPTQSSIMVVRALSITADLTTCPRTSRKLGIIIDIMEEIRTLTARDHHVAARN